MINHNKSLLVDNLKYRLESSKEWKVILYFEDTIDLIETLISLDGFVKAICVLNPKLSYEDQSAILNQYDFSHVISDLKGADLLIFSDIKIKIIEYKKSNKILMKDSNNLVHSSWLVPTSGTTSTPKLSVHTFYTLSKNVKQSFCLKNNENVWGLLYDISRYAGFQVLFQSLLGRGTLICPNTDISLYKKIKEFHDFSVTNISASPTLWRKILMTALAKELNLKLIILGGEAADQKILNLLNKTFLNAKITHVFASTESGVAFSTSDLKAGFPISFLKDKNFPIDVKIERERLYIKSKGSAPNYVNSKVMKDLDCWIDTGDLIEFDKDRFFIIGRANGIINVGGDKIIPEKIRNILLSSEIVQDVVVYGKKNPFTGNIVSADIELIREGNESEKKKNLKIFIYKNLSRIERPQIINYVESISINTAGKVKLKHDK